MQPVFNSLHIVLLKVNDAPNFIASQVVEADIDEQEVSLLLAVQYPAVDL